MSVSDATAQRQCELLSSRRNNPTGWQAAAAAAAQRIFSALQRLAQHKFAACIAMAILPMVIRLVALRAIPVPEPSIHDEFSYLLAADTFRSGRLTNPPHPMWQHFETFHELMQPTYQSKYPPAQGMFLAMGWKLFGNPWYGVCIGFGLMCGCLCWMLQGWMPPVYALLGTLAAIGQIGIFGHWMNSYWGGAVAAAGGSLVLGALPRLTGKPSMAASAAAALGMVLVVNSRPYEGSVMIAAAAVALWWRRARAGRPLRELASWLNVAPFLVIGACGAALMGYYNYRVTGHPWKLPYMVYQETYSMVPQWIFLPPRPQKPEFRHDLLRRMWTEMEAPQYTKTRHNPFRAVLKSLHEGLPFYFSTLIFALFAAALMTGRSPKLWMAAGIAFALWCAVLLELWYYPHYLAAGTGLVFVMAMYGIRMLRVKAGRMGAALLLLLVATPFLNGLLQGLNTYYESTQSHPRRDVIRRLLERGSKHLIIVRYTADHSIHDPEWVFNAADIDASPIVWARDMGEARNRELIDYYRARTVWLLHPDPPLTLTPYGAGSN
jgi:hypothetical protein